MGDICRGHGTENCGPKPHWRVANLSLWTKKEIFSYISQNLDSKSILLEFWN